MHHNSLDILIRVILAGACIMMLGIGSIYLFLIKGSELKARYRTKGLFLFVIGFAGWALILFTARH